MRKVIQSELAYITFATLVIALLLFLYKDQLGYFGDLSNTNYNSNVLAWIIRFTWLLTVFAMVFYVFKDKAATVFIVPMLMLYMGFSLIYPALIFHIVLLLPIILIYFIHIKYIRLALIMGCMFLFIYYLLAERISYFDLFTAFVMLLVYTWLAYEWRLQWESTKKDYQKELMLMREKHQCDYAEITDIHKQTSIQLEQANEEKLEIKEALSSQIRQLEEDNNRLKIKLEGDKIIKLKKLFSMYALTKDERKVVKLVVKDNMKIADIATKLSRTISAIKARRGKIDKKIKAHGSSRDAFEKQLRETAFYLSVEDDEY